VALKVSYSARIGANLPIWIGPESGITQQHGLDVQLEYIASSSGIPAVLSGQVQLANVGGSEALSAAAQGADLVIIGITLPVYPFVLMAPAHITTVDQLKGKTIGVSNIGSTSDTATRVTLRNVGLDPNKDVNIVAVGSLENRMAALFQGAIDGGVAQPPEQLALEDKGFHVIYDLAANRVPAAGGGVVVQRSWLKANRDVAQRYIDSLVEATVRSRQDKEFAMKVLQKYLNTDDQRALEATYEFFVGSVIPKYPTVTAAQFADTVAQLSSTNSRVKDFDLSTLLDNSLVQSAIERNLGGS
jgi:NitT/TauT family transport system substrate-binding protein